MKRTWNHTLTSGRSIIYYVTACLLHNEPTSYTLLASIRSSGPKAKRKRVWIGRLASRGRRETWWSTHGQVEAEIVSQWRTEPVHVEKCSDDLWVGVKGQSNQEIARTPRNAFRCSVVSSVMEVELPIGLGGFTAYQPLTNSECHYTAAAVRLWVLRSTAERGTTQTIS